MVPLGVCFFLRLRATGISLYRMLYARNGNITGAAVQVDINARHRANTRDLRPMHRPYRTNKRNSSCRTGGTPNVNTRIMIESLRGVHDDLQGRAVRGTAWSGFSVGCRVGFTILSMPILARLLTPEQYGIVALTTLVTEVIGLFGQLGLNSALIQRKHVHRADLETAFWTDIGVGAILMLLVIALSPLAAWFFHQPVLIALLCVTGIGFLINGFSSTYNTILTRAMRFRAISMIEITSVAVRTLTAVGLAWAGFAYWALIVAGLASFIVSALGRLVVVRWRPRARFAKERFQRLFHFGRNVLGDNMLFYLSDNIDYFIIGRRLGAQSLGYYEMAFSLPDMVRKNLSFTLTRVLYPVYSRVQDQEMRLRSGFFRVVEGVSLMAFPLLGGLALLAPQFVPLYFGPQWHPIIAPVQFLAIAGMFRSATIHVGTLLHARGRPDISMKMTAVRTPLVGIVIWIGTYWGLDGAAAAYMGFVFLWTVLSIYITSSITGITLGMLVNAALPALSATAVMISCLFLTKPYLAMVVGSGWTSLLTNIAIGCTVYLGTLWMLWNSKVREIVSLVGHLKRQA